MESEGSSRSKLSFCRVGRGMATERMGCSDVRPVRESKRSVRAVMMTVSHVCGPIHGPGSCGGTMSAVTTPGLKRRSSSVIGDNYVTFIGCKPTVVQFDPLSSGDLLLPGDFIDVQIIVPENERTKIRVDVTSCEAAYITMTPKALP